MPGMDLSRHFSLTSSNDVNDFCAPILNPLGITYFNYLKIYSDSSRELLTNNAAWIDHFYQNELYKSVGAIDIEHLLPKGYFLWSELSTEDPIYQCGRKSFNIDNGITIVIKRKDVTHLYIFASYRNNVNINNFYVKNIDLLQRFILYFTDKASDLIKQAAKNRIYLPEKQIITPTIPIRDPLLSEFDREKFYHQTTIDKYYLLGESDDFYLTAKQAQCAAYFAQGATAKQCAKALHLSPRTVESHLKEVKDKIFDLTGERLAKDKLIIFLREAGIHNAVFNNKKIFFKYPRDCRSTLQSTLILVIN
jgi:DNA-binding CsgD family transcriptional regulator